MTCGASIPENLLLIPGVGSFKNTNNCYNRVFEFKIILDRGLDDFRFKLIQYKAIYIRNWPISGTKKAGYAGILLGAFCIFWWEGSHR